MKNSKKNSTQPLEASFRVVLTSKDHDAVMSRSKESGITVAAFLRKAMQLFARDPHKAWQKISEENGD